MRGNSVSIEVRASARTLFKEVPILSQETFAPTFQADLTEAAASYRLAIRENPFAEDIPLLVGNGTTGPDHAGMYCKRWRGSVRT